MFSILLSVEGIVLLDGIDEGILLERLVEGVALDVAGRIDIVDDVVLLHVLDTDEGDLELMELGSGKKVLDVEELVSVRIEDPDKGTVDLDAIESELLQLLEGDVFSGVAVGFDRESGTVEVLDDREKPFFVVSDILLGDFEGKEVLRNEVHLDHARDLRKELLGGEVAVFGIHGEVLEAEDTEDGVSVLEVHIGDVFQKRIADKADLSVLDGDTDQFVGIEGDLPVVVRYTDEQFASVDPLVTGKKHRLEKDVEGVVGELLLNDVEHVADSRSRSLVVVRIEVEEVESGSVLGVEELGLAVLDVVVAGGIDLRVDDREVGDEQVLMPAFREDRILALQVDGFGGVEDIDLAGFREEEGNGIGTEQVVGSLEVGFDQGVDELAET